MFVHHNSRRRFLAFLGLVGAVPTSVWAQSSSSASSDSSSSDDGPPSLDCDGNLDTDTYSIRYTQTFTLSPQNTLDDEGGDALISIDLAPSSQTINPPFKDGAPSTTGNVVDVFHPLMTCDMNADILGPSFHANLIVPSAPTSIRGQLRAGTTVIGDVACTTETQTSDPLNLTIDGEFDTDALTPVQSGPVQLTLIIDGQKAAVYVFDFTRVDWQMFKATKDQAYKEAKNVAVNADDTTNVPGCTAGGGCFFTTATVETLGLGDDCWELRTLRAFRDGPLAETAAGRALTARYYAEAPRLVEGVSRRADAAQVWLGAYWTHILPCAVMARLGLNHAALSHYARLFARLEKLAA